MKLEVAEPDVVEYDADGVLVRVEYSGDEVQKFLRSFDDLAPLPAVLPPRVAPRARGGRGSRGRSVRRRVRRRTPSRGDPPRPGDDDDPHDDVFPGRGWSL
jgi:hypothetical protein